MPYYFRPWFFLISLKLFFNSYIGLQINVAVVKDKNKDKNNNLLKSYSPLGGSKFQDSETVIFNSNKFRFGKITYEAATIDYFTVKQRKLIDIIISCHYENLDTMIFNQALNRPNLKKEARNFR